MNLQINLQDGFNGDEVIISMNGGQLIDKKEVRTRTQIGLADTIETRINGEKVSLDIQLLNRQLRKVIELQVTHTVHIGISISQQNEIEYHIQDTPFYYL